MNLLIEKIDKLENIIEKVKNLNKSKYKMDLDLIKSNIEHESLETKIINYNNLIEKINNMKRIIELETNFVNLYFVLLKYLNHIVSDSSHLFNYKINTEFGKLYKDYIFGYLIPLTIIKKVIDTFNNNENLLVKNNIQNIFNNTINNLNIINLLDNTNKLKTTIGSNYINLDDIKDYLNYEITFGKEYKVIFENCKDIDFNSDNLKNYVNKISYKFNIKKLSNLKIEFIILYYKCKSDLNIINEKKNFIIIINNKELYNYSTPLMNMQIIKNNNHNFLDSIFL